MMTIFPTYYSCLTTLTLSDWKDLAAIIGVIVAVAALVKGVYEYVKQGSQKRAEQFFEMEKRFGEIVIFKEIAALTENDDPKLKDIALKDKYHYLGFFEQ